jgi:hypothetical protein
VILTDSAGPMLTVEFNPGAVCDLYQRLRVERLQRASPPMGQDAAERASLNQEIIMFRKISIALVAAAALGSAALAPTSASAWGRGGGFGRVPWRIS